MAINIIKEFFKTSAIEGILLLLILFVTLILANSSLASSYFSFIQSTILNITWQDIHIQATFSAFINDGLMSLFFMLLALEIKREMLIGELANPRQMILPVVCACAGVLVPALIYIVCVGTQDPAILRGWAVPVATDVALALGLLALLGKRVPFALKLFLSVLAVADDLIAIIIIAFFYTDNLSIAYLGWAVLATCLLILLNCLKIRAISLYFLIGIVLWVLMHHSGIHATLAGVILGFCIPMQGKTKEVSPLIQIEHNLRPWVAYAIVPLFIFANAGVPLFEEASSLSHPLPWGIALGLFLGKQLGIFAAAALLIKSGLAAMPKDARWIDLYGISVLAGIGFTMSLFVSNLAFQGTSFELISHMGILLGSGLSAVVGMMVLYVSSRRRTNYVHV
jgi:NhaA family Na+:H+ antiporter